MDYGRLRSASVPKSCDTIFRGQLGGTRIAIIAPRESALKRVASYFVDRISIVYMISGLLSRDQHGGFRIAITSPRESDL